MSPTSPCLVSMALQGKAETVALIHESQEAYSKIAEKTLKNLCYFLLDKATNYTRIFSDRSFQNNPDKDS